MNDNKPLLHKQIDENENACTCSTAQSVSHLMYSFPKDIFIIFLCDLLSLIIGFNGQFYLLYCSLLCMQFLQILVENKTIQVRQIFTIFFLKRVASHCPAALLLKSS